MNSFKRILTIALLFIFISGGVSFAGRPKSIEEAFCQKYGEDLSGVSAHTQKQFSVLTGVEWRFASFDERMSFLKKLKQEQDRREQLKKEIKDRKLKRKKKIQALIKEKQKELELQRKKQKEKEKIRQRQSRDRARAAAARKKALAKRLEALRKSGRRR